MGSFLGPEASLLSMGVSLRQWRPASMQFLSRGRTHRLKVTTKCLELISHNWKPISILDLIYW